MSHASASSRASMADGATAAAADELNPLELLVGDGTLLEHPNTHCKGEARQKDDAEDGATAPRAPSPSSLPPASSSPASRRRSNRLFRGSNAERQSTCTTEPSSMVSRGRCVASSRCSRSSDRTARRPEGSFAHSSVPCVVSHTNRLLVLERVAKEGGSENGAIMGTVKWYVRRRTSTRSSFWRTRHVSKASPRGWVP